MKYCIMKLLNVCVLLILASFMSSCSSENSEKEKNIQTNSYVVDGSGISNYDIPTTTNTTITSSADEYILKSNDYENTDNVSLYQTNTTTTISFVSDQIASNPNVFNNNTTFLPQTSAMTIISSTGEQSLAKSSTCQNSDTVIATQTTNSSSSTLQDFFDESIIEPIDTLPSYYDFKPLSNEFEKKIKQDYINYMLKKHLELTIDDVYIVDNYGFYNDGIVVVLDIYPYAEDADKGILIIDNKYEIHLLNADHHIYYYLDSNFLDVEDAYKKGYISEVELLRISDYSKTEKITNNDFVDYPELDQLTEAADLNLRIDYASFISKNGQRAYSESEVYVAQYFGTYNGKEVVVMWIGEMDMTDEEKQIELAGYSITMSSGSYEIMVHSDSVFYNIYNAYDNGLITESDLAAISYYSSSENYKIA